MRAYFHLALALTFVAPLLSPSSAEAIIIRHDVDDTEYVVQARDYPAMVDLLELGDCIATLIRPQWLITAAHCAVEMNTSASLSVGGQSHAVASVKIPSNWDDDLDDIALIELTEPVTHVEPIPVYEGSDEVGQVVWFVGRGDTNTGLRGQSGASVDGKTRRASNTIVAADSHWIQFVFNSPDDAAVTPLEGISGDGDSGGPALLVNDEGTWVVGLSSYQDEGNFSLGRYGVEEFYTRVSQYGDWMNQHMGPADTSTPDDGSTDAGSTDDGSTDSGTDTSDGDASGTESGDADAGSGSAETTADADSGGCSGVASSQLLVWLMGLGAIGRRRRRRELGCVAA
jgi:hypothetical protein